MLVTRAVNRTVHTAACASSPLCGRRRQYATTPHGSPTESSAGIFGHT